MWGIIPAAGLGRRIQPLAFSKELLPVGSRVDEGVQRPCAVSEYLIDRMILGGARKIAFVISREKSDILQYYGPEYHGPGHGVASVYYVVQSAALGLCDAIFRAAPLIDEREQVLVGLPDTIWFPRNGFSALPEGPLSFLLFPVDHPKFFDAVLLDASGRVREIQVKRPDARTNWIWGAFKLGGRTFHELHDLWLQRRRSDEFIGALVNAYIEAGGEAIGVKAGESYVDVGTFTGYCSAIALLSAKSESPENGVSESTIPLSGNGFETPWILSYAPQE